MSEAAGDESGARTLGAGVFLLLAGLSVALMVVVSVPVGIAALVASLVAGVLAARKRTSDEGLPGGSVDSSERLEGFIIDPLAAGEADPFVQVHDDERTRPQQWADGLPTNPNAVPSAVPDEFAPPAYADELDVPDEFAPPRRPEVVDHPEPVESFASDQLFFDPGPAEAVAQPDLRSLDDLPPLDQVAEVDLDLALADLAPLDDLDLDQELEDELERDQRIGHLRSTHAEAVEQLNVALARWYQLAGDDADPYDPEPVIRAHDPQLVFDPRHIEASPTVRTVAAYHRSTQARWRVLWASLGADEVPDAAGVDAVLADLLAGHDDAIADLARLEAAEARVEARAVLARPVVLVEPSAWISEGRLEQVLSSLPDETDVVVVERAS